MSYHGRGEGISICPRGPVMKVKVYGPPNCRSIETHKIFIRFWDAHGTRIAYFIMGTYEMLPKSL